MLSWFVLFGISLIAVIFIRALYRKFRSDKHEFQLSPEMEARLDERTLEIRRDFEHEINFRGHRVFLYLEGVPDVINYFRPILVKCLITRGGDVTLMTEEELSLMSARDLSFLGENGVVFGGRVEHRREEIFDCNCDLNLYSSPHNHFDVLAFDFEVTKFIDGEVVTMKEKIISPNELAVAGQSVDYFVSLF
mgnify:CR=1 FL=1